LIFDVKRQTGGPSHWSQVDKMSRYIFSLSLTE
jgi:hypothetical protein